MAKIRGFKPDLWTDEDFVELSPLARLLWLGMWNFACDNGHLADKSKQIKMRVLPTDDVNVAELLREIADQGLIQRADGWITVPNLTRHQKPDRRYFTTCEKEGCEEPPETVSQRAARRAPTVHTSGARGVHTGRTPSAHVDGEVKGSEVKGSEVKAVGDAARPTASRPDVDGEFEALWQAYPKKVGKGQAVKAFRAARKKADFDTISAGLAAAVAGWRSAGTDPQFIPNPTTWLNGERWADQPTRPAGGPSGPVWEHRPPKDWDAERARVAAEKAAAKAAES